MRRIAPILVLLGLTAASLKAQTIQPSRGADPRVDYPSLTRFGPWDDRNYQLTQEDLALLAPNEAELTEGIPAFYRVELRKTMPEMLRSGKAQYPRSALPRFLVERGGFLFEGKIYRNVGRQADGRWVLKLDDGMESKTFLAQQQRALAGEVRISSPVGAAESAISINPANPNQVVAGSNGPGSGQVMHYSTNGGSTWTQAAALPLGGTCCDPTQAWKTDGTKAYAASLGGPGFGVLIYRSANGGQTWDDLVNEPGASPRRLLGSNTDKEYIHVDNHPTSPFKDNLYVSWHEGNTMLFAVSTDSAHTFTTQTVSSGSGQLGIGSDITTDKNGNVYYLWPAFNSQTILVRKSTNGGTTFAPAVTVASTQASFIFPIPSIETREAFVYVAADTDRTNGPFANSIYAAWTDSTAPTGSTAANNHARIQVAYSRDGGATWTVTTPHPTADANTVDRWHPWLGVGPNGNVYVAYYDTRNSVNRTGVDFYYSVSTDGAQTWSAPDRLTTATSPNISDGFEFGDYNGLDVMAQQLITIFTDNRNESGGGGNSVDVYAAGTILAAPDAIFSNGFESGNTSAWSLTLP